jgi:hypothetical protein
MPEPIDFIADTSAIIGVLRRDGDVERKISGKNFAINVANICSFLKLANALMDRKLV